MPQLPKSERVLRRPVQLYRRLLSEQGFQVPTFEHGLLAMGLELETQARILEALEGTSLIALNKTEISTALRTLLRRVEIDDDVLVVYDQLIEYEDSLIPTRVLIDVSDGSRTVLSADGAAHQHASSPPQYTDASHPADSETNGEATSS